MPATNLCPYCQHAMTVSRMTCNECGVSIDAGPMPRFGAKGDGTSVYFRDPDGSLLEFISYW